MVKKPLRKDAIDHILWQWSVERPELELSAMGTVGRLKRCAVLVQRTLDATFSEHGLTAWEFDVLATLRRNGSPYRMAPTELFSSLMVTSGTMTHRLQKLEQVGLVSRPINPDDARSTLVELTPLGLMKINAAVSDHVENEERMLASLSHQNRRSLDEHLKLLLKALED